ncbi:lysozyme inhibitor LprI family protein [Polaromonas sp.]|uniref:lysozyme inhibitor LprI family protein n=1 Tax=Polaromonas sp. TaxID=1869339 RepID=UPI002FC836A7
MQLFAQLPRCLLGLVTFLTCTSGVYAGELCGPTGSSIQDTACSQRKLDVAERQLNERYKQLLSELDEITKENPVRLENLKPKLIAAQRAWVSFRQAECSAIQVWYTNGSLQTALYNNCMRSHAERRIEELNSFMNYRT